MSNDSNLEESITGKKYIESKSSLVSKNITVCGHRTSVRLEPEMWKALKFISTREECTIHDICSLISLRKKETTSLPAAIRVFLMLYYRASSTESGHQKAGHGDFKSMKRRAGISDDWSALNHKKANEDVITDRLSPHLQAIDKSSRRNNVAH